MSDIIKQHLIVKEVKKIKDQDGVLEVKVASESTDREGDVLVIGGIKLANYKKNPVVLWGHNYSQLPIGKAERIFKSGTELMARVKFAISESPFAAEVYRLYAGGYLNAFSIGFIPEDVEENKILTSEMLEFSAVTVPANAEALAMRGLNFKMFKALEEGKKQIKDIKQEDLLLQDNELIEKIKLLEKSVSALKDKVDKKEAGVEKTYKIAKISSQSIEAVCKHLKDVYGKRKQRS